MVLRTFNPIFYIMTYNRSLLIIFYFSYVRIDPVVTRKEIGTDVVTSYHSYPYFFTTYSLLSYRSFLIMLPLLIS